MKRIFYLLLALALMVAPLTSCIATQLPEEQPPVDQTPETPEDPEATEPEQEEVPQPMTLKIGSFNIGNGSFVGHDLSVLANDITSQGLDIVGLQEVDRFASRSQYLDTMKRLSELTGYQYYYYSKAINIGGNPSVYGQDGEYGTGILSKYPITFEETTQLASGGYEQRVLSHVTIQVEDAEVHFFNAHLTYNTLAVRKAQMEKIEELASEYD